MLNVLKNTNYNRAFFQILAVFSGKRGRFTPWVFCGFSPRFVHRVCWITGRFFQQHCSGSSVFWKTRAFIHRFVVVGLWWVSLVLEEAHWRAIAYHSWRYAVVCLIFDEKCLWSGAV